MGYTFEIEAILSYVEKRVKQKIDFSELERTLNYSYRHIRGLFKQETNISLSRYILSRKISYCAREIQYSSKSLTDIAFEYNLGSYDTFTRAFKRETGIKPSEFKMSKLACGIKHICMGIYAPSIIANKDFMSINFDSLEKKDKSTCILYGVSKVHYGRKADGGLQFTPFPMCLQVVLNYLGERVYYSHIMAASGASFRLTFNKTGWDHRAVDDRNIYANPYKAFELSLKKVGRAYKILDKKTSTKEDFIKAIIAEIDKGRPLLALGVVGPPDTSIITGYKDNCKSLLGLSLVQDHLEFSNDMKLDESGYFESDAWWENTEAILMIGDKVDTNLSLESLLENALEIFSNDSVNNSERGEYYNGQKAYKAVIDLLSDDSKFTKDTQYASMIESMLGFRDVISMIWDGRSYGAGYIRWIGTVNPEITDYCNLFSSCLRKIVKSCSTISDLLGGLSGEESARNLTNKTIRMEIVEELKKASLYEIKASKHLESMIKILQTSKIALNTGLSKTSSIKINSSI